MSVNNKNWQELKKPNTLEIKEGGDKKRKATFVAEPLERGFGLTLGTALRRVLLRPQLGETAGGVGLGLACAKEMRDGQRRSVEGRASFDV